MLNYELIIITIDAPDQAKVINDVIIYYHAVPQSIITNESLLFISNFWLLLY